MTAPIRVVVVDDQAMVRGALASLLSLEDDIEVCGQAANGAEAIALLAELTRGSAQVPSAHESSPGVDVLLTDIEMPVMDGITTTEAVRARFPGVRILVLTTFGRPGYVQRALNAGASGFLVKDAPSEELAEAIRRVHAGLRQVDASLAVEALTAGASPLTDREVEILREVARGGTVADIAQAVGLSQGTVRNHISAAMTKTGARTRAEAAAQATANGWL
ncbi:DNA-binding response regulator [Schaalia sp. Marseille-Q2122]|uniref:response regulator transcription factor n=1 Tax=Schaalia sp. Marseille-Q2122 TaxID=2736604 RepID=UPI00158B9542|nr:response regulator transcription factor [Schaalia sp. Marseille-Q2122]